MSQVERIYVLWLVPLDWKELFAIRGMLRLPFEGCGGETVVWRLLDINELWLLRETDKHLLLVQNCVNDSCFLHVESFRLI